MRHIFSRRWFLEKTTAVMTMSWLHHLSDVNRDIPTLDRSPGIIAGSDLGRIKEILASRDRYRWLFTGDSITMGAKHTHGYRSYTEIFHERLQWELGRVSDVVINTGISGHTTNHVINDFEWRVAQFQPVVVSMMFGTNDCSKKDMTPSLFGANLRVLVEKIRKLDAVPILHTPNPIIINKAPERRTLSDYVIMIREVARLEHLLLVDHFAHWEEIARLKSLDIVFHEWLNDPLHPNGKGHQMIARELFRTLDIFDPMAATCGGAYYEGEH